MPSPRLRKSRTPRVHEDRVAGWAVRRRLGHRLGRLLDGPSSPRAAARLSTARLRTATARPTHSPQSFTTQSRGRCRPSPKTRSWARLGSSPTDGHSTPEGFAYGFGHVRLWPRELMRARRLPALGRACPRVRASPKMYPSRTRGVPIFRRCRQHHSRFAGLFCKPSDGLEPSTPSLPFRFRGGKRGHAWTFTATKAPQTGRIRRRDLTRAWTRVVVLMFAPRSQGMRLGRQPLPATRTQVPGTEARPQTRLRGPVLTARSNARVDALGRARVALARF